MSTQRSPVASTSKRGRNDFADSENFEEDPRVRTQTMPGSLSHIVGDVTKYKAIIVPIELAPTIEKIFQELLLKLHNENNKVIELDTDDEVFSNSPPSEEDKTTFIREFGTTRRTFFNALQATNEKQLIENVSSTDFDTFKNARRIISKWYVTGCHLFNKLKGDVDTNKYLKLNFDISVAVTDINLKEKCTSKILETKKTLEHSLTTHVLAKALFLNQEVKILHDNTPKNVFLKAFRVVTKANKQLYNPANPNNIEFRSHNKRQHNPNNRTQHNTHDNHYSRRNPQHNTERNPYERYNWNERRPRIYSRRHLSNNYEDDYPPPMPQNNNYRRYKRQPSFYEEEDYVTTNYRQRPRSFYGRPSRTEYHD